MAKVPKPIIRPPHEPEPQSYSAASEVERFLRVMVPHQDGRGWYDPDNYVEFHCDDDSDTGGSGQPQTAV